MDVVVLLLALVVILIGAELFTNGIEWFGRKLNLSEGAIGSVLAAVGTALPETMIPFIAIVLSGGDPGGKVGVGAILGAPFMLSTLAMFVTGTAVWLMRRRRAAGQMLAVNPEVVSHDMAYFAVAYSIAIGAALLPVGFEWPRRLVAVLLIGIYAFHVLGHLKAEAPVHHELEPLRFHKLDRGAPQHPEPPRFCTGSTRVLGALIRMMGAAWGFGRAVEGLAASLGRNPT